jgi:DNA replication ATP-dependent helicase Dna2
MTDIDVACGMLYYIERAEMIRVPAIRDELRGMIIGRNEIASYSRNRTALPEMLRNKNACERCYAKTPCFIYHKVILYSKNF